MNEHAYLMAEKTELENIIKNIPESDTIEKLSFESRLASVKAALECAPPPASTRKATLTFRGNPVLGSHGIDAEFSGKATSFFSDAVAAIAAGLQDNLSYMGKIPNKKENKLLITSTAIGSFGFEFELPTNDSDDELFPESSPVAEALDRLLKLLELTTEGDDDQLSEIVEEIHPRAVKKVADLLDFTANEQAWCGLSYSNRSFRFQDHTQLEESTKRIRSENITETEETLEGAFIGVLPESRHFEFLPVGKDKPFRGRISADVKDPANLNKLLNNNLTIRFEVVQVGQGRPKYTLPNSADLFDT